MNRNAFDIFPAIQVITMDYTRNLINAAAKESIQARINNRIDLRNADVQNRRFRDIDEMRDYAENR